MTIFTVYLAIGLVLGVLWAFITRDEPVDWEHYTILSALAFWPVLVVNTAVEFVHERRSEP